MFLLVAVSLSSAVTQRFYPSVQLLLTQIQQAAGCSFYNPQLAPGTWTPKLIPVERNAKKQAECLLFVVTPDTRGVFLLLRSEYAFHVIPAS